VLYLYFVPFIGFQIKYDDDDDALATSKSPPPPSPFSMHIQIGWSIHLGFSSTRSGRKPPELIGFCF